MTDNLTTLFPEILEHIFTYLKGEDIFKLGCCSKFLRLLTLQEHVWKECAQREYSVELNDDQHQENPSHSPRLFYMLVLRKYGSWLGKRLQRSNFEYYGGLATMMYKDWSLYLILLSPPPFPHSELDLQAEALCTIYLDSFGEVKVRNVESPHIESLSLICSDSELNLKYNVADDQTLESDEMLQEFVEKFGLQDIFDYNLDIIMERFRNYVKYIQKGQQTFTKLSTPCSASGFEPIVPGIYKGAYSSHGIELINVYYEDKSIIGCKVTGDPNVPCMEITFKASLADPIVFPNHVQNLEQIEQYLKDEHTSTNFSDVCSTNMTPTIFDPMDCHYDGNLESDIFQTKTWQFRCSCQISPEFFSNPQMIDGVFIVFTETVFAVIFLELGCLSIYHKGEVENIKF